MAKDLFGEAVFRLEVDEKNYQAQLKSNETATRSATQNMQNDFAKVTKSTEKATQGLNKASVAAGGLGAAAAATGSPVVGLAGQLVSLAASGGVVTVAIAAVVAVVGLLSLAFRGAAEDAKKLEDSQRSLADQETKDIVRIRRAQTSLVRARRYARIELERTKAGLGPSRVDAGRGVDDPELRALLVEKQSIIFRRRIEAEKKTQQEQEAIRLKGLAAVDQQRVQAAKDLAAIAAQSEESRVAGGSVQTVREAESFVSASIAALKEQTQSQKLIAIALSQGLREGSVSAAQARSISGIQTSGTTGGGKAGGFVEAGRFNSAGTGLVTQGPEVKAQATRMDMLKETKRLADTLERMENSGRKVGAGV